MDLASLISNDQIRGVLTVSEADLSNEALDAYVLADDLGENLDRWLPGWEGTSDTQQARLLRLYAKYFCAATVAATAPVFVLTKQTDGANEGQRSGNEGFRWLADSLMAKALSYRDKLLDLVGEPVSAGEMVFAARVIPTRDPVTEPRSESA